MQTIKETLDAMRITEADRHLLELHFLQEVTQQEIAAFEGTHQTTISRRLRSLRRQFSAALGAELD